MSPQEELIYEQIKALDKRVAKLEAQVEILAKENPIVNIAERMQKKGALK